MTDQATLAAIARAAAQGSGLAEAAVARISDQALLAGIVKTNGEWSVRHAALERIKDQSLLATLARQARDALDAAVIVGQITDRAILESLVRTGENGDLRANAAEHITNQDVLEAVVTTDPYEQARLSATINLTSQRVLAQVARSGTQRLRAAALEKLTDPAVLAQIAQDDPSPELRRSAILKVKDVPVLLRIAKNEPDQTTFLTALVNLKDRQSLVDVARTARYKSTRAIMGARLTSSWRRDLEFLSSHCTFERSLARCEVSVENKSETLAYSGFTFLPAGATMRADPEMLPGLGGTAEPGQTSKIQGLMSGDWRQFLEGYSNPIDVRYAIPVLPQEATDLSAGGEAGPYVPGPNRAPQVPGRPILRTTTSSDVLARIVGVTTEITIDAWDPDFDPLTFVWTATNGSISGNGPTAVWQRVIEKDRLVPGAVTVTVTDGHGGETKVTYEMR